MTEPQVPARKGRSNAIVTYETLAGISEGLTRAIMGIERLDEKLEDSTSASRETQSDHEARIRILEASLATALATNSTRVGAIDYVWKGAVVLASLAFTALTYFK